MKKLTMLLIAGILLLTFVGCSNENGVAEPTGTAQTIPDTQMTTEPTTEAPTQPAGVSYMELPGTWQRTYAEVEGEKNENTGCTVVITGESEESLMLSYTDQEVPLSNGKELYLELREGPLYYECGNDQWHFTASTGEYEYKLTLLQDDTLLLQLVFQVDGAPMVSTQWFVRSE